MASPEGLERQAMLERQATLLHWLVTCSKAAMASYQCKRQRCSHATRLRHNKRQLALAQAEGSLLIERCGLRVGASFPVEPQTFVFSGNFGELIFFGEWSFSGLAMALVTVSRFFFPCGLEREVLFENVVIIGTP